MTVSTSSVVLETRNTVSIGRTCFNRRGRKNKCSSGQEFPIEIYRRERMKRDSNTIEVGRWRNCYSYGGFGHIM